MQEDIKKILEYGVMAPSGDNSQPWEFGIRGNDLFIFNCPQKDTSLYNYKQNANHIAIGALIENILIAATRFGYVSQPTLFPDLEDEPVCVVEFKKTEGVVKDTLFSFIEKRHTNRRAHEDLSQPLDKKIFEELKELSKQYPGSNLALCSPTKQQANEIANLAATNEKIVLENKSMHNFLFSHITWSERQDKQKKGFYVKTLELKGPEFLAFKLFSKWRLLRFFNRIVPISDLIATQNAKIYKQTKLFIGIITTSQEKESFISAGRLMQRVWLITSKHNLGTQPLGGIPLLGQRLSDTEKDNQLSSQHVKLALNSYNKLRKNLVTQNDIAILLRTGHTGSASARTLRKKPILRFEN